MKLVFQGPVVALAPAGLNPVDAVNTGEAVDALLKAWNILGYTMNAACPLVLAGISIIYLMCLS